jgi:hypothetical protein
MTRHDYSRLAVGVLLSLAPVLVQCDSRETPPPSSKTAAEAVAVPVEVRADGLAYRPGEATPFTGEAVELHPASSPAAVQKRIPYRNGKKHGSVTRWTPKGKIIEDRRYDDGLPLTCVNYHTNGQKKIEVVLNARDLAEGPYLRWHDNGVLQAESTFDSDERFHGDEKVYNREGALLGHYRKEHGALKEIVFETPEERTHRIAHMAALEAAAAQNPPATDPPSH